MNDDGCACTCGKARCASNRGRSPTSKRSENRRRKPPRSRVLDGVALESASKHYHLCRTDPRYMKMAGVRKGDPVS